MTLTELIDEFTAVQRESRQVAAELRKALSRLAPADPWHRGEDGGPSFAPAESPIWDASVRQRARR